MPIDHRMFIQSRVLFGAAMYAGASDLGSSVGGAAEPLKYKDPYIDVDEWRDTPVRHRYVHGGFKGSDLLFSAYFPPKELYQGRFFQPLQAVSGNENMAPMAMFQAGSVGFAIASGGYLVISNQGSKHMFGGDAAANAAVAQFSRELAAQMYGPHRPYGYVYGGSGGAFKTLGCVENHPSVWDDSVPFVHGTPSQYRTCSRCRRTPCACCAASSRRSWTRSIPAAAATCMPGSMTKSALPCRKSHAWVSRRARGST